MRRTLLLFALLTFAFPALAQNPRNTAVALDDCTTLTCDASANDGRFCFDKDDGSLWRCESSSWVRKDIPACAANPPTGTCSGFSICQVQNASSWGIYGCGADDAWYTISGAGDGYCDGAACDGTSFSNVDAVTVDSLDSTQFLRSDTNDSMAGNLLPGTDNTYTLGNASFNWSSIFGYDFRVETQVYLEDSHTGVVWRKDESAGVTDGHEWTVSANTSGILQFAVSEVNGVAGTPDWAVWAVGIDWLAATFQAAGAGGTGTISPASLTSDRTYTMPDKTGTFAMTSDLIADTTCDGAACDGTSFSNVTATGVDANSVALGTDTTGNYAGSDSEGGGATTLIETPALSVRYYDYDTDGDSTPDLRVCGDYDGDGNLYVAQDVKACVEDFNDTNGDDDLTTADLLIDTDGDNTPDHTGRTVHLLPGTYQAGFRDEINVGGITIIGAGDSTFIDIVGDCNGSGDFNSDSTVDSLDNGDTTASFRQLFLIEFGRFHIEKLAINGGSSRWEGTKLTSGDTGYCNINDVDEDAIANVSDPAPGGTCTGKWCPVDSHYLFVASDDGGAYYTFRDLTVQDVDRTAFAFDGAHDHVLMDAIRGKSMGEHTAFAESEMTVSNSSFENCGRADGGYGFVFAPNDADIINTKFVDTHFIDCPGGAIGLEAPTSTYTMKNLQIDSCHFRNTASGPTPQRALLEIIGDSTAPTQDISITNSTFDQGTSDAYAMLFSTSDSATAFDGVTISGNTIRTTPSTTTGTRGGFSLEYAENLAITNNFVTMAGDTNDSLANTERGIQLVDTEGAQLSGNVIEMTGQGVVGIYLLRVDLSAVSNNKIAGPGYGAAELESRGIVIDGTSGNDSYGNVVTGNQLYNVRQALNPRNYAKRNLFASNFCDTVNNCAYPEHATNTVQNTFTNNVARACNNGCYADNAGSGSNFWDSNVSWDSFDFTNVEDGHGASWLTSTGGDDTLDSTTYFKIHDSSMICGPGANDADCDGTAEHQRQGTVVYQRANVSTSNANAKLSWYNSPWEDWVPPYAGTFDAMRCEIFGALTSGSYQVFAKIEGTNSDMSVTFTSADATGTSKSSTSCTTGCDFTAGQQVRMFITPSTPSPTTTDLHCELYYHWTE